MNPDDRTVCPLPHLGYCVRERCNFWDETAQQCSGLCFDDYFSLEDRNPPSLEALCTVYWTEDYD